MAQTGYTPILIYSSSTAAQAPAAGNLTNSTLGSELAINITDGKLFYKDNANAVQVIAWKTTPTTAGGTGLTSYTAGDLLYYASGTTLSKLAIGTSGQWLGSSGSAPQWNSPAALTKTDDTNVTLTLGGNASTALLNAASLTLGWTGQLATSRGGTGLSSFTANGVLYASSTSALATSSNFTYDGTTFNVAGAIQSRSSTISNTIFQDSVLTMGSASGSGGTQTRISMGDGTYTTGQLIAYGSVYGAGFNYGVSLASNAVNSGSLGGTFNYSASTFASRYWQQGGQLFLQYAVSGTAGNPITWLTACNTTTSGNLAFPAGKGIDFSANSHAAGMTSELLNWYEEGTFTPTIVGTTSAGTGTYSAQTGRYTRTGNRVYINLYLSWSAHTGTGNMRIDGLPFTSANVSNTYSALSPYISALTLTAGYWLQPYIGPNRTFISLEQVQAGATSIAVPMDTSAEIIISGFYEV